VSSLPSCFVLRFGDGGSPSYDHGTCRPLWAEENDGYSSDDDDLFDAAPIPMAHHPYPGCPLKQPHGASV
jgi:hypothetical protein